MRASLELRVEADEAVKIAALAELLGFDDTQLQTSDVTRDQLALGKLLPDGNVEELVQPLTTLVVIFGLEVVRVVIVDDLEAVGFAKQRFIDRANRAVTTDDRDD